jgi:aryl-alcohol dehydrogenase-like predicted oxidoreductase
LAYFAGSNKNDFMRYTSPGKSGLSISEIGFGCMSLGEDDTANAALLGQALDKGINFFDTADLYQGRNESSLGKALLGKRKEVVIATKVGNQWRPDGSGWDWNPRKEYILAAADKSLLRLQTDYIDLYQLHGGTPEDPIDETIEAFELLQQQGKIRCYGISSIRPNVIREYVQRSNIVSVMMQYSLLDRRPEESCLPLLLQHNIGVLARGSLAKGLLVNKPATAYLNYTIEDVKRAAAAIQQVSGPQRNAAQSAVQFVLQQPGISSAVAGIRTAEQLEAIVSTSFPPLAVQELQQLKDAVAPNYYDAHR